MKIIQFYTPATFAGTNQTQSYYDEYACWEVIIDQVALPALPYGHVEFTEFVTKPTKKQLRRFKKDFRLRMAEEIVRFHK